MRYKMEDGTIKDIPCETTRLEVDQIPGRGEDWTKPQQELMKELVRRSIFIEMEPSRGRLSLGPTWRWQLRRIYCPAFGTGLRKYTAIKWTTSDLKYFLTNPQEKCEIEFETRWKKSSHLQQPHPLQPSRQQPLDSFFNLGREELNDKN